MSGWVENTVAAMVSGLPDGFANTFAKRGAATAALALLGIIAVFAFGEASWGHFLIIFCVCACFWLLLTIVDKAANMFSRNPEN
jgi:hypothetical protein